MACDQPLCRSPKLSQPSGCYKLKPERTTPNDNLSMEPLTDRELQILRLMAEGQTNREIARELVLSPETVKWYNKQSYSKLGVGSRTQAVAKARERGLLDRDRDSLAKIPKPTRRSLPSEISSFVGREREISESKQLLRKARLVTLTGPGGTGKTRLALQIARAVVEDYADGAAFVSLAAVTDPALVAEKIAQELGVAGSPNLSTQASLERHLRDKQSLLVVDNFEHVLEAAPLVTELLAAAPRLSVLTTSREVLHLSGEHEYLVPPLTVPVLVLDSSVSELSAYESVALFVQRAGAASTDFHLTRENAGAVAGICLLLDGLPLAIELAAARLKLFSPQQLLTRLERRLDLLTGGSRDLPARQRTLRSAIEWSYDLLNGGERQLFARMTVFRGGCSFEAVEAICGPELTINLLDGVQSLLNKSLLYQDEDHSRVPRFLMLETIREYAGERLSDSGEEEKMRNRHLAFFLNLAQEAEPKLDSPDQTLWANRLELEHDNLRAALAWSQTAGSTAGSGLRLAGSLAYFWQWRGYLGEGRAHLSAALSGTKAEERTKARAKALYEAGRLAYVQGDFPASGKLLEESISIYRELGPLSRLSLAHALIMMGDTKTGVGQYTEAVSVIEEGLAFMRELDERNGIARAKWKLGWSLGRQGDHRRASQCFTESLAFYRQVGDKGGMAMVLAGQGETALRQGDCEEAAELLEEGLALRREVSDTWGVAASLGALAWVALSQGDLTKATTLLTESLQRRRDLGDIGGTAWCLEKLAEIALTIGLRQSGQRRDEELERAARLFGAAQALRAPVKSVIDLVDQPEYERQVAVVRAQLGEAMFSEAWAEGQALTPDQTAAYASRAEPG